MLLETFKTKRARRYAEALQAAAKSGGDATEELLQTADGAGVSLDEVERDLQAAARATELQRRIEDQEAKTARYEAAFRPLLDALDEAAATLGRVRSDDGAVTSLAARFAKEILRMATGSPTSAAAILDIKRSSTNSAIGSLNAELDALRTQNPRVFLAPEAPKQTLAGSVMSKFKGNKR